MKKLLLSLLLFLVSSISVAQVITIQIPQQSSQLEIDFRTVQRVVMEQTEEGYYLVQDFYESGNRLTDPFLIKDKKQLANYDYNQLNIESYFALWYENGEKWEEGYYIQGKKQGVWRSWLTNGKEVMEYQYQAGKLVNIAQS